jgi:hypothetical protein
MAKERVVYKDVVVAPSSDLGKALASNDQATAAKLYKATEADFRKMYGNKLDALFEKYKL